MKCFFCPAYLHDPEVNGILECPRCLNATRYICSGSMKNLEVWYVHVRVDPFLIEWDLEVPVTRIYSGPMYKETNFIMELDQLLPYSKEAVSQLIQRFQNIKVFL